MWLAVKYTVNSRVLGRLRVSFRLYYPSLLSVSIIRGYLQLVQKVFSVIQAL
jgi:hypothetical protein